MQEHSGTSPVQVGESFIGEGAEAAHINTVLGDREGPVGTAWATSLAMPRPGHIPFVTVLKPNLPVKPPTLFVRFGTDPGRRPRDPHLGRRPGRRGRRGGGRA